MVQNYDESGANNNLHLKTNFIRPRILIKSAESKLLLLYHNAVTERAIILLHILNRSSSYFKDLIS